MVSENLIGEIQDTSGRLLLSQSHGKYNQKKLNENNAGDSKLD
jgi:hypothetical protein